jgi:sugar/nucleoside kinase (ribokinase family)
MPLLVVGSIALDSIETPHGKTEECLGGSAVYFSYAAHFFSNVRLVGVVGKDFPHNLKKIIHQKKNIDATGVQELEGKTFRWKGAYKGDMNVAETISVELNVFGEFKPVIPENFKDSKFIFLANGGPSLQKSVLDQIHSPHFTVVDTMNHWIKDQRNELLELIKDVDAIVLNDGEARLLTQETNLIKAGKMILKLGPKFVIIKKGEHGSILMSAKGYFIIPAYPTEYVKDPTGAGDSFAGGMMGYLAKTRDTSLQNLKRAIMYGTIVASFNIEDFSLNRFQQITFEDIESRVREFEEMLR